MPDLNDLRVFEKVASLRSFSAAARAIGLPKSTVSRSVKRLETDLGVRLLQRSTREVVLTDPGVAFLERCVDVLVRADEAMAYVGGFAAAPRGLLRVGAGIGFGVNVLSDLLPEFLKAHPDVDVALELTSRSVDLIGEGIDVAVRIGPLSDSGLIATRLGSMRRYVCASPDYLALHGMPATPDELRRHHLIEMPGPEGRPRPWTLTGQDGTTAQVSGRHRVIVNEALTIHRLVVNGAGVGCISGYLCAPDIAAGCLIRLLPGWTLPSLDVSVVFPSRRQLSPTVRAFVEFLKAVSNPGSAWQEDSVEG